MFLSKLFSIFKRKKDNQSQDTEVKPAVTPSGTVGAAVGLSQPNQAVNPASDKVAQATEPDIPKADIGAASETISSEPTAVTPSDDTTSVSEGTNTVEPQPPVEEPEPTPDVVPAPPTEEPSSNQPEDDSQNIAV